MAVDGVVPRGLAADDIVLGMMPELDTSCELGITPDVLLANVEVVKPDTPPPRTDSRISPTKPSTTSAAPLSTLYPAGKTWGTIVSHGGSVMMPDDTALEDTTLDETLDGDELRVVLLTELRGTFELCCDFDACD